VASSRAQPGHIRLDQPNLRDCTAGPAGSPVHSGVRRQRNRLFRAVAPSSSRVVEARASTCPGPFLRHCQTLASLQVPEGDRAVVVHQPCPSTTSRKMEAKGQRTSTGSLEPERRIELLTYVIREGSRSADAPATSRFSGGEAAPSVTARYYLPGTSVQVRASFLRSVGHR
jgi:hypothetical protein